MEKQAMRTHALMRAAAIAAVLMAGAAQTQAEETKTHEFACTAATVGGAVAGVALGSLLGGGLGRTLFETAGGTAGAMLGHTMKCPQ
jgi:hypothetical protein